VLKLGKIKNRLLRYWTYFRRGHGTYLAFLISFTNFIVIQYRLLVQYIPILELIFKDIIIFAITFACVYVPTAIIIGWYDYRKLSVPIDATLGAKASPWVRDLSKALILIAEGKNREAVEILKKWASK